MYLNFFRKKNETVWKKINLFELLPKLSLFGLFRYYWFTVQRRENKLSSVAVYIICSYIFSYLKKEWVQKRRYSSEDQKFICSAMDVMYDEFDPTLFVNDYDSYIKKLLEFEKK